MLTLPQINICDITCKRQNCKDVLETGGSNTESIFRYLDDSYFMS